MGKQELYSPSITIQIIYQDLPDLIEIETHVQTRDFSGLATAYTSPSTLSELATALASWARDPVKEFDLEAGTDTDIGWLVLRFFTVDLAGHIMCHVTLATNRSTTSGDVSRLSLSFPTEAGLVETFARHLSTLSRSFEGEAILEGLAI